MSINWDEVEEQFSGDFNSPAEIGKRYTVKFKDATMWDESSNGSIPFSFSFAEDDEHFYPFSKSYYLSFKEGKDAWRQHYAKNLLVVMGIEEKTARKAVEVAESKKSKGEIATAYEATFKKAAAKGATTEIIVGQKIDRDGNLKTRTTQKGAVVPATEAILTDNRVAFKGDIQRAEEQGAANAGSTDSTNTEVALEEATITEDGEIDISDIPF